MVTVTQPQSEEQTETVFTVEVEDTSARARYGHRSAPPWNGIQFSDNPLPMDFQLRQADVDALGAFGRQLLERYNSYQNAYEVITGNQDVITARRLTDYEQIWARNIGRNGHIEHNVVAMETHIGGPNIIQKAWLREI